MNTREKTKLKSDTTLIKGNEFDKKITSNQSVCNSVGR